MSRIYYGEDPDKFTGPAEVIRTKTDINDLLAYIEKRIPRERIIIGPYDKTKPLLLYAFIDITETKMTIHCKGYRKQWRHQKYIFSLNDQVITALAGLDVYDEVKKFMKIPHLSKIEGTDDKGRTVKDLFGQKITVDGQKKNRYRAAQLLESIYRHKDNTCKTKRHKHEKDNTGYEPIIYDYDLNSAFAAAARDKMPDFRNPRFNDIVKEGEIGFNHYVGCPIVHPGEKAHVIFKEVDTPQAWRDWIDKNYLIKSTTKDDYEKADAKARLVMFFGYTERINFLYRAYVINTVNEYIKDIADRYKGHIVMMNTDAIHSRVPITEIEEHIARDGEKVLGGWKREYVGPIKYWGFDYQKQGQAPVMRGVVRGDLPEDYDLLKKQVPITRIKYRYNKETNRVEEF